MYPGSPAPVVGSRVCEGCRHFAPDPINPEAGMGSCDRGRGMWHPMAPHCCREREERKR